MENRLPLIARITSNPVICEGKPTIRNMRLTVYQVLELLAEGRSQEDILFNHPFLKKEDIQACLLYAAKLTDTNTPGAPEETTNDQELTLQLNSSPNR